VEVPWMLCRDEEKPEIKGGHLVDDKAIASFRG
jgi:hypothetical protein